MMYVAGSLSIKHVSDKHKVRTTGSCKNKSTVVFQDKLHLAARINCMDDGIDNNYFHE